MIGEKVEVTNRLDILEPGLNIRSGPNYGNNEPYQSTLGETGCSRGGYQIKEYHCSTESSYAPMEYKSVYE